MAKRKEANDEKESIEERVLKKYRKYKKDDNPNEDSLELDPTNNLTEEIKTESHLKVSESDTISAEKIFRKVKKIKDEKTKNAIKLRKESRKLAKIEAQKQETEPNSGNKSVSAITYLNDWKYRKSDWKFKKSLQIWLLRNWRNLNKICDKDFDLFIEYIFAINSESLAKKRLESEAKQLVDKQTEDEEQEKVVERARRVLQCY